MHQGGGLIQEGTDNIDINTETVDGKNTFHSMARAVFQIRHYAVDPNQRKKDYRNGLASDTSCAVGYSSVEMLIFSMSRLKIRMT
jgi:hypothetical protein